MTLNLHDIVTCRLQLSDTFYQRLLGCCVEQRLAKKKMLLPMGKTCSFIGFVQQGILYSYRLKNEQEYVEDFYVQGSFVTSYASLTEGKPSEVCIRALTSCSILMLPYDRFQELLEESAHWYKLANYIAQTILIGRNKKESALLDDNIEQRYQFMLQAYPKIEQYIDSQQIASFLGLGAEPLHVLESMPV